MNKLFQWTSWPREKLPEALTFQVTLLKVLHGKRGLERPATRKTQKTKHRAINSDGFASIVQCDTASCLHHISIIRKPLVWKESRVKVALNRWRLRNGEWATNSTRRPTWLLSGHSVMSGERDEEECQRDTIESLTRSVHGISPLAILDLRWRWTASGKKWIVIEFWRRAGARRTFSAEFPAKTIPRATANQVLEIRVARRMKSCQQFPPPLAKMASAPKLSTDFFIRPHNYARERTTFFCCGK